LYNTIDIANMLRIFGRHDGLVSLIVGVTYISYYYHGVDDENWTRPGKIVMVGHGKSFGYISHAFVY
jgi:hypothetical protein